MSKLIYFDNAATTFPKPETVFRGVRKCMEEYCGNPGRSGHFLSFAAAKAVYDCRIELAECFNLSEPENIVFTLNTTYALNMAIKGLLSENDHVIISNIEHNSVYRTVIATGCKYDIFNSYQTRDKIITEISQKIKPNTRVIICNHASNICPLRNPISSIGDLAKKKGIYFIVDAAQSAGIYPIDMKEANIDALCIPGHKGLYGIQGCGAVLFSSKFRGEKAKRIKCLTEGGNGVNSLESFMPPTLPERLETGTLPTPAIAGLLAGIKTVNSIGIDNIREHENMIYARLRENLRNFKGLKLYCPEFTKGNILLFNFNSMTSVQLADELDREGVCVRAGFHCSPLAHSLLKTGKSGALRISLGGFNSMEEADKFTDILKKCTQL
ncbi:MAG: aminotransferase class V-fold PLP-dependent enzyme [Clostridia bacterium]|nr:aminotransferase class V-fold PLP-dependent enzyme [Clostridia bacterium]